MELLQRRPVVGVMGSGREPHVQRARRVGEWIARAGYHLLTGGGAGVMAAVTEAFVGVEERRGLAIGILPAAGGDSAGAARPGYPNPWVEIAVRTHLPEVGAHGAGAASRNHLNVLTSDVVIVLPGSVGTASEARLAVRYGRPCIAWLANRGDVPGLPDAVPVESGFPAVEAFVRAACRSARGDQGSGTGMR
ncbi:MAG: molybdenum cofactor carrier protein [Acidobacteria bacterium]|nr:molybdenum cofactor carrier protein [Acidobacteriota bacterium]